MKAKSLLAGLGLMALFAPAPQAQIRNPIADSVFNGFTKAYLIRNGSQTYFCNSLTDRNRAYFWEHAYLITAAEDIYDASPTDAHRQIIKDLVGSFLDKEKGDWKWDPWDDDIEWVVNIFIRGFRITGDSSYLAPALANWKMVWNRGWTRTYGGGIWERMDDTIGDGKGGLSNWPFIFEGVDLYLATGDTAILNKCIQDYAWTRTHAYDPKSGRVYENTGVRGMGGDDNSYNSGLLVNAAASLFEATGDSLYYKDAVTAATHYIGRVGASGIMTEDHPANGYFGCEQFARGLSKFARQNHLWNKYWTFLANNSAAAWTHRRTDYNLTWNNFSQTTSMANLRALEAQGSVVIQASTPFLQTLTRDSLAPVFLQAEDFNYMKGVTVESDGAAGAGKYVGSLSTGDYLEYIVQVPASGVYTLTCRVAGTAPGAIALQLNGAPLGTIPTPATGQTFANAATKVNLQVGIQSLELLPLAEGLSLDWIHVAFGDHAGPIPVRTPAAPASFAIRIHSAPVAARLTVDFGDRSVRDISVSDASGRILLRSPGWTRGIWSADASALPTGFGILSARTSGNQLVTQRFMR
jgi:hypothetical protein